MQRSSLNLRGGGCIFRAATQSGCRAEVFGPLLPLCGLSENNSSRFPTALKNWWWRFLFITDRRRSRTAAMLSAADVPRREVQNSFTLSMTSRRSLLFRHLYFSSRHLHPVPANDSQSCTCVIHLATSSTRGRRASPRTLALPVLLVTSLWGISLWFHSFSHCLSAVSFYTTVCTQPCVATFVLPYL